jgi:NADH-quinone oxidoreductase subunit N
MAASSIIEISRYTKKMKKKVNFSMIFFMLADEKTFSNFISFFPEIILGAGLIFTLIIILIRFKKYTNVPFKLFVKNITLSMSFIALSLAFLTVIALIHRIYGVGGLSSPFLFYSSFTIFFKSLLGFLTIFSLYLLRDWWGKKNKSAVWEMPLLLWSSLLFMYLLVSSNNLLVTFLLVEGLSICLYFILVSELKGNTFTNTLLYFLLGGISSIFFGYGLLRTYWTVGSFDYKEIHVFFLLMTNSGIQEIWISHTVMLSCLLFSLIFKLAAFPCYFWIRNLYCAATLPTIFFIGVPVKVVIFIVLFRLFGFAFIGLSSLWINLVLFCGLGSIILGCIIAVQAQKIHAFIAGSGINHIGFVLCSFGCQDGFGFTAAIFYLVTYVITSLAFFLLLLILKNIRGKPVIYITDLYVSQNNLFIQGALSIIILSFAGIPPFVGFFSKYTVLCALYNKGYIFLCAIVIVTAIIAAYYYLRILCFVNFKNNCINAGINGIKSVFNKNPLLFATKLKEQIVSNIKSTESSYLLFILVFYIFFFLPSWSTLMHICFHLQITGVNPIIF